MSALPSSSLSRNQLLEMYYFARLARDVEERLVVLFRQSRVIGGLYRSLGQEGESVACAYALQRTDAIVPLIRNMGALMTMGVRPREIFLQYMAKGESNSRGRDLNIHVVHLPDEGEQQPVIVGPISMLGDSISVAAGIALGARMRGRDLVSMAWLGDGAMSTGAFHEGMNFAAVRKAPLVVVGEDNKYAYSTPTSLQSAARTIDERASGYGIPHERVDGNDMLAVYDVAKRMVDRARAGEGAAFIGVDTMRMQGHAQHDDMRYVPRAVVEEWAARDAILRFRRHLVESGTAGEKELDDVDGMARSCAAEEARLAEEAPPADPSTLRRGVYAGDDFAVPRLEFVRSPFAGS